MRITLNALNVENAVSFLRQLCDEIEENQKVPDEALLDGSTPESVVITLETGNAAFVEGEYGMGSDIDWAKIRDTDPNVFMVQEVCRILRKYADRVEMTNDFDHRERDRNGNTVLTVEIIKK
jgi:hypothetical protein